MRCSGLKGPFLLPTRFSPGPIFFVVCKGFLKTVLEVFASGSFRLREVGEADVGDVGDVEDEDGLEHVTMGEVLTLS